MSVLAQAERALREAQERPQEPDPAPFWLWPYLWASLALEAVLRRLAAR